ncbi:MAG: hypothetical protein KME16_22080 [Scytolyngbya sp. HA4215-MV1]|jgi:hypothetical protein|nr:hypothetical protein [Scytolyngbya sp. HA4215-MV1]
MPLILESLPSISSNYHRLFFVRSLPHPSTIAHYVIFLGCWIPVQASFAYPIASHLTASNFHPTFETPPSIAWTAPESDLVPATDQTVAKRDQSTIAPDSASWEIVNQDDLQPVKSNGTPVIIAGADNFNPALQLLPPQPETFELPNPPTVSPANSAIALEALTTDFRSDYDNFGQQNQFIEETARFRLPNDEALRVKTGFNTFQQRGVESIINIPLQVGWEGKWGPFKLRPTAGVDIFDRLSLKPNLNLEIETKLFRNITLMGVVEQAPYKFNAKTLDNEISAWHFGTNLFWQIDRDTSLFSLLRFGNYNDGNHEQQSFTRLERKFGDFFAAANLFNWSYDNNFETRSGYFSPPDFLVYNGEIGWQGDVFKFLRCRVAASLGRQRLNGDYSGARSYQAHCTAKLSPNFEADFGYSFSDIQNRNTSGNGFNSQSLTGQLRFKF